MNIRLMSIAWRNLKRNIRRNVATGSAIAAGFVAFMLGAGYAYRVENVLSVYSIYPLHAGHFGIYKSHGLEMFGIKPREFALSSAEQAKIESVLGSLPNVEFFGKYLHGKGLIGNGCKTFPFIALGVDPTIENRLLNHPNVLKWNPHLVKSRVGRGIWEYSEDFGAVSLSEGLAELLGKSRRYDELENVRPYTIENCSAPNVRELFARDANIQLAAGTWAGSLNAVDGEVVSTYSTGLVETNHLSLTTSLSHLQKLYDSDGVSNFSVWLRDSRDVDATMRMAAGQLRNLNLDVEILSWKDERLSPYYVGTMHFIYVMVGFVGAVLALVVLLSIFNSATMTVIERSQEIGMMRSLGYKRRAIRIVFLWEGLFLTLIAVVIGVVLGLAAMNIINGLNLTFNPPGVASAIQLLFVPNFYIIVLGSTLVGLLGVLSTWFAVAGVVRKNTAALISGSHR